MDDPDGGRADAAPDTRRLPHERLFAGIFLGSAALSLVWTVMIAVGLVPGVASYHARLLWTGLDLVEAAGLGLTGVAILRRKWSTPLLASFTAALLLLDAWFDIVSSSGASRGVAVALALVPEVPLALTLIWYARVAQRRLVR